MTVTDQGFSPPCGAQLPEVLFTIGWGEERERERLAQSLFCREKRFFLVPSFRARQDGWGIEVTFFSSVTISFLVNRFCLSSAVCPHHTATSDFLSYNPAVTQMKR